ncbi:dihydrodipicolinate synthase family protein [Zeaxanthinibacter enoshimensis]|uniref:dihydrodipicolinate synthase family protein n=1 Tax=Zeaxanthinibacter enoshimensis TaxID=392009 RepID=UPI00356B1F57
MKFKWEGVMPAMTTKFTAGDSLDLPAFKHNLRAQLNAGVHGVILGGSLGEASTLSQDELQLLLRDTVAEVGDSIPVISTIATGSTRNALLFARQARDCGASGLMVLPPMRYKATEKEILLFFESIAKETDLPVMIYNNPVDYQIGVSISMFETLLKYDNIQAVKESTRDISNITRIKNEFGDRLKILCGVDTLALESLLMGADGWVAGLVCAFPAETVAIYELVRAGRRAEALELYRWFLPLLELDINPQLVQNIKLAEVATGLGTEHVRLPRLPLSGDERIRVERIIKKAMANKPELPDYKRHLQS